MAVFEWKKLGVGDWSVADNWTRLTGGTPPPGSGDVALFPSLADPYTVNVTGFQSAGAVVIQAAAPSIFSIDGSLTTGALFYETGGDISTTVAAKGLLHVTRTLELLVDSETITIAGTEAGGRLELGNFTVGAALYKVNFAFDNTGPTSLNTGVIQFDLGFASGITIATQVITDVAWGDEFVIKGANFTGDTVTLDANTNDLTVRNASGSTVFTMTDVHLQTDATNAFAIVNGDTIEALCYARGTMIRTPAGELPVEKLRPGNQVVTLVDGQEVPQTVTWLGHRRIGLAGHPRPETVAPIRIQRDAFADGRPHRDLVVSPDHAIFVDGKLICARQLVNGATIRQERDWTAVDYYHVELDRHAILLAEGLPAESYIDTGNSGFFANSGAPLVLHPDLTDETDYPTREAGSCAPFVSDEASVRPIWQRLADRAAAVGRPVSQHVTTMEADLRLLADQRPVEPVFSHRDRVIFVLPRGAREVRLVSRAQSG